MSDPVDWQNQEALRNAGRAYISFLMAGKIGESMAPLFGWGTAWHESAHYLLAREHLASFRLFNLIGLSYITTRPDSVSHGHVAFNSRNDPANDYKPLDAPGRLPALGDRRKARFFAEQIFPGWGWKRILREYRSCRREALRVLHRDRDLLNRLGFDLLWRELMTADECEENIRETKRRLLEWYGIDHDAATKH